MADIFRRKFLRARSVRANSGFEVEFHGMHKVRYSEAGQTATFAAEPAVLERGIFKGKRGWIIALSQLAKWDDGTAFSVEQRELIHRRSKDALTFMGVPHVID
jgi:hypothetical protein